MNSNIYDKLNKNIDGNPNQNYNILEKIRSITFRDKLYLKIKQTTIDTARYQVFKTNLHAYNKSKKKYSSGQINIF